MKNPKTYRDLNSLQLCYMRDVEMLQSQGYPDDLFDELYKVYAKHLKQNNL
jgi:hypothetical protein